MRVRDGLEVDPASIGIDNRVATLRSGETKTNAHEVGLGAGFRDPAAGGIDEL